MQKKQYPFIKTFAVLFLLLPIGVQGLKAEQKIVRMESRTFPDPIVWDSNYTALLAASDGRVYVGLNHHGAGASVAVYDPKTDTMKLLGDMNRIIGQENVPVEPQAKVHSQICEGSDGKIYFGTHLSAFYGFAKFTSSEAYPGGHWMVYDPDTDTVTDLGIALKGNGLLTMTIDPQRKRLYAITYPQAHFLIYDIQTQITTDMGQVQNWDAISRTLAVDDLPWTTLDGSTDAGAEVKYGAMILKKMSSKIFKSNCRNVNWAFPPTVHTGKPNRLLLPSLTRPITS